MTTHDQTELLRRIEQLQDENAALLTELAAHRERHEKKKAAMRKVMTNRRARAHAAADKSKRPGLHRADRRAAEAASAGLAIVDAAGNRNPLFKIELPTGEIRWENLEGELIRSTRRKTHNEQGDQP